MWIYNSWSNKWIYLTSQPISAIELYGILIRLDESDGA